MEDRIAQLEARIDDLESVVDHLSAGGYAPTHPQVSQSLQRLRVRCSEQLHTASPPAPLAPGQPAAAEPDLTDDVFAAAAAARKAAARVEELRASGADDDTILEARITAEETQNRARELSEKLSAENPAPEATE